MNIHKNAEGYADPTVGQAEKNLRNAQKMRETSDKAATVCLLAHTVRQIAELAGFEVVERIILREKKTGKVWR